MKKTKASPMTKGSVVGKLLTPALTLVAAAVAVLPAYQVAGSEFDLAGAPTTQEVTVPGEFGGTAIFRDQWSQPTGTGVFDPFLTLDSNGQTSTGNTAIESAYNTDGTVAIYLDQQKPNGFNKTMTYGSLQKFSLPGHDGQYVAFVLDANEPGGGKSLISIDNIRIYSSAADTTASVANDITKLDNLGTKVWAMNDPLKTGATPPDLNGFNVNQWVKLDANQSSNNGSNANGGSGQGDMIVYIPVSAFDTAGTADSDFVWFYNLNGVHYNADGESPDLAAQAGFEEWKAFAGPNEVPDGGNTLALLGSALTALGCVAGRRKMANQA